MISKEEVLNIANLSKLYLDESEIQDAQKEMDGMINFANQINELGVNPEDVENVGDIFNAFREDEIKPSYPQEKILENVDGGRNGFFYVSKSN